MARNSKRIPRENGIIIGKITRQAKVITKGKALKKITLKIVKGVVVTTTTPEGATFLGIWLNYTRKMLVRSSRGQV
jgi:hypothetical protein